jgi:hypothetical protein
VTIPSSARRHAHVFGVATLEHQRLLEQAQALAPEARWGCSIASAFVLLQTVDLGCGLLGVLVTLSTLIRPS